MKKVFFLLAFTLVSGFTAFAQKNPPSAVITAFKQKFSNVREVKWGREKNGEWEAEFEQNGVDMSANFNDAGKWLETETEIKIADLPAAVKSALGDKKVKEAAKIQRADGSTVYEAEVKHKDLLFDDSGKLLSEAKD